VAKEVVNKIKLQVPAGKATPAPPVGTVLGPAGINLQDFCSAFNDATKDKIGDIVPCEISIYEDRSFDFVIKTPPAGFLIKKFAKIDKGSAKGANQIVATITQDDLKKIAEIKMPDLNAYSIEDAMNIIAGTARNMGVAVRGLNDEELAAQGVEAAAAEAEAQKREAELAAMEEAAEAAREAESAETEVDGEEKAEEQPEETTTEEPAAAEEEKTEE